MNASRREVIGHTVSATLGLMLFGLGIHLVIRANLGVAPWDVFHIGLSNALGILYGDASILVAAALIALDLLIGEKIGLGTVLDALVVGKTVDLLNWLNVVPASNTLWVSLAMMAVGFLIQGYAQYLYMRVGLCCGPRDSLLIGLSRRVPRLPVGLVNVFLLATALFVGWRLGGPVGLGTLLAPVGLGGAQQLAFNAMKFDPKAVAHQDIIASARVLCAPRSAGQTTAQK